MANQFYPKAKKRFFTGKTDMEADTIHAVLLKNTYAFNPEHEFLVDIQDHVLGSVPLQDVQVSVLASGVCSVAAADLRFEDVVAGNTVRAVVLLKSTGVAGTSPLIAYFDNAVGLPAVTTGAPQVVEWSKTDKVFYW